MDREELASGIMKAAYIEGDFTLRSGRKSTYLIDKYEFETRPRLLSAIASHLAKELPPDTDRLAGVELGGVPVVVALALHCKLPYVIVRKGAKGHGLDRPFEGELKRGENLSLIEDITTTGGAAVEAANTLKKADAGNVTVHAVVDRMEGAAEAFEKAGFDFHPLFTKKDLGIA